MISDRVTRATILCALLGAVALVADEPAERHWNGFIQVREQFPLTAGYLILEPTSGFTLTPGTWEVEATVTLSNTFTASKEIEQHLAARTTRGPFTREMFDVFAEIDPYDQTFYLDTEVARTALRARHGLGGGFEIAILLPLLRINGGRTDGLVEGFHDLFGFDQEGRKGVVRDQMDQFISGQGLEVDIGQSSGVELGDLVLSVKKRLVGDGSTRSLALQLDLKLPTGADDLLLSSGGTDVGLSLVGSRCWSSRCLHAMAGYVFAGSADALPTESQALFSTALGFEQELPARWSLIVQAQYWQSYLDDLGFEHFAEDTIQLGGTAIKSTSGWGDFIFGLSENSFSFKNSSDVTFHLGWRQRFQ